jgi:hypothetical protein
MMMSSYFFALLLHLPTQYRAIGVLGTSYARKDARIGADADCHLCRALAVGIDEPHVTACEGAGDGDVDRQRGFADTTFGVTYC